MKMERHVRHMRLSFVHFGQRKFKVKQAPIVISFTQTNLILQNKLKIIYLFFTDLKDDTHIDTEKETVKMPGEREEGFFEMLGDLVTDGITRIFQSGDKKDDDDENDEEDDYEEKSYEVQQAENGDSYKVGHADSGTVAVEGDAQRALETGNVVT
jgi:hypothetical protein